MVQDGFTQSLFLDLYLQLEFCNCMISKIIIFLQNKTNLDVLSLNSYSIPGPMSG